MGEALTPWWVAIATGIVTTLGGVIGKLWTDNVALRRELAAANAHAEELREQLHRDHKRDLRKVIGWPTSLDPPPPFVETRILVREEPKSTGPHKKRR